MTNRDTGRLEEALTLNPRQPISDEEANALLQTMDGAKWANAFCRATGFSDEAWALSWFCNAIMAGFDEATRRQSAILTERDQTTEQLKGDVNQARHGMAKWETLHAQAEAELTTLREEHEQAFAAGFQWALNGTDKHGEYLGGPVEDGYMQWRAALTPKNRPQPIANAGLDRPEPIGPIQLNDDQQSMVKEWAADDRLWTTQETVEFNLRTFARAIVAALTPKARM